MLESSENHFTEDEKERRAAVMAALSVLVTLRNTEANMRWEGAKLGIYFNLSGFVWVGYKMTGGFSKSELVMIFVGSIVSAGLNQYLYTSLRRSGQHFKVWNLCALRIEELLPKKYKIEIFKSAGYIKLQKSRLKVNDLLLFITKSCIIAWALVCAMVFGALILGGFKS